MIRYTLILFCATVMCFTGYGQKWTTYTSSKISIANFSIDTPVELFYTPKALKTSIGEIPSEVHYGYDEAAQVLYMINYVQYPAYSFDSDSIDLIDSFLVHSIRDHATNINGEIIYTAPDTEYDHGYRFRIHYNNRTAVLKGKAILSEDDYYLLQVFSPTDKSMDDKTDIFLSSFKPLQTD